MQGGAKLLKSCRRFILELKAGGVLWIFCVLGAIKIPGQTEIGASPPVLLMEEWQLSLCP